jgi:type IV pilus assembly protein PilW
MNKKAAFMRTQRGFSLVELLVAVVIGLVVTLAASSVLLNFEGNKRKMTTVNDVGQTGAYVSFLMDQTLRSAGSGFATRGISAYGCSINASRSGAAILPAPAQFPQPFSGVDQDIRLAPVVIYANASETGSDVLAFMKGTHGFSESPVRVIAGSITATGLRLQNTLGWRNNDLALIIQQGSGCMVQQVQGASAFVGSSDQNLPLAGLYFNAAGSNIDLAEYGAAGANTFVAALGNADDNRPDFRLMGVGANNTLMSYDLLRFDGATDPVPLADGVVELRARYGIDANRDGVVDNWVSPSAAGWIASDAAGQLFDGSAQARDRLRSVVAIRVGLILRTSSPEKENVAPESLALFSDLGALRVQRDLAPEERLLRHRTVEFTVPLRNVLSTNASTQPITDP